MARQAPWTVDNINNREGSNLSDTDEMEDEEIDSDVTDMSTEMNNEQEDGDFDDDSDVRPYRLQAAEQEGVSDRTRSPILGERRTQDSERTHHHSIRTVEQQGMRHQIDVVNLEDSEELEGPNMIIEEQPPVIAYEPQVLELHETPPNNAPPPPSLDPLPEQQLPVSPVPQIEHSRTTHTAEVGQPLDPPIIRESNTEAGPSCGVTPKKVNPVPEQLPDSPDSEDEGQICSICFEPWSNSGDHRLSSLKCGHLFGYACIIRWLKGQKGKCPQCNAKATKKDIRVLYAKSLKVLDTSERDRILKDLEKEKEAKRKLELEHAQTKLKYELKAQLVVKLQEELRVLKKATAGTSGSHGINLSQSAASSAQRNVKMIMYAGIDINKDGGCRVMAYNEWLNMLVVSMPSQVAMFPGYGVKKVNMLDLKAERYVPIHQKQIRDLAFNPAKNDLLLSVAMDKMVKLTNICSNAPVGSFTAEAPLWSCCWNADEANKFFVGTATGCVVQYDTRITTGPVRTIKVAGSGPVVSMCYVPYKSNANFSIGGLLVARLQSCSFVELKEEGIKDHTLPLEGPFTCVSLEKSTRHILVSCRPSQKYPHARHIVCELQSVNISPDAAVINQIVTVNLIHTFQGGTTQKVLSRSCIFVNPVQVENVVVCASDESNQSTCLWDLSLASCMQQLRVPETVIDILPVRSNQNEYLTLLTDKSAKFYKWIDVL